MMERGDYGLRVYRFICAGNRNHQKFIVAKSLSEAIKSRYEFEIEHCFAPCIEVKRKPVPVVTVTIGYPGSAHRFPHREFLCIEKFRVGWVITT